VKFGVVFLDALAFLDGAARRTHTESYIPQVREKSEISRRNSCSAFSLPKRNKFQVRVRKEKFAAVSAQASKQKPAGEVPWSRTTSPKTPRMLLSAKSHSARTVSRALTPASNCCGYVVARRRLRAEHRQGCQEPCMVPEGC